MNLRSQKLMQKIIYKIKKEKKKNSFEWKHLLCKEMIIRTIKATM